MSAQKAGLLARVASNYKADTWFTGCENCNKSCKRRTVYEAESLGILVTDALLEPLPDMLVHLLSLVRRCNLHTAGMSGALFRCCTQALLSALLLMLLLLQLQLQVLWHRLLLCSCQPACVCCMHTKHTHLACADGPNGLVGNHHVLKIADVVCDGAQLRVHHLFELQPHKI